MLLPSRADNDYRISVCHSQVLLPQFVCKEDTTPPYPHICDNIIADFPKISSSFQNTTLHSNKYDKIFRYDTPGNVFLFVYFLQKKESQTQDSSYAISNSFSPSKIIIRIAGPAAFRICPHLVAQHAQKQHPGQQEKPDQDSYDR